MKNRKGFTLVELILVLAVTTILLGTVIAVLLQSIDMYKIDETKSANQDSLNIVSTSIESKMRTASAVSLSGSDCVVTTPAGNFIYSLDTTTHTISVNSAALTQRIASFSCVVDGTNPSKITVSIATINDRAGNNQSLTTTIFLRKGD